MSTVHAVLDFLQSLSLLYEREEWQAEDETLLSKVLPSAYKEQVEAYVERLLPYREQIAPFVTEDYHLCIKLSLAGQLPQTLEEFRHSFSQFSKADLEQLLAKEYSSGKTFTLADLEGAMLSLASKWQLSLLLDQFAVKQAAFLEVMPSLYALYTECAAGLEKTFSDQLLAQGERLGSQPLYQTVLAGVMTESDYQALSKQYLLLVSGHHLVIGQSGQEKVLAMGLFVFDYYQAKKGEVLVNEETMQTVLKVLADQTRYGILKCIGSGLTSNKAIASLFSISPSGVSYQLKFLAENHIIAKDPHSHRYVVNASLIHQALLTVIQDLEIEKASF